MKNFLIVWPRSTTVRHINYHFTQFGEVVGYLNNKFSNKVMAIDLDVENIDYLKFLERILAESITHVAIYVAPENFKNALLLAKELKKVEPNIYIMAYGPLTKIFPKVFLKSKFDVIYSDGDFECAIESFFFSYPKRPLYMKGCSYIVNACRYSTQRGTFIKPDEWGFSLQNDIPIQDYCELKGKNRYVINISRGCPFNCEHCLIPKCEGTNERRRSIKNLKEYLSIIYPRFTHIKIWAANFTLNKKYLQEFCNMVIQEYGNLTWECATRIDLLPDDDILKLMYNSGCRQISLGVETIHECEINVSNKKFSIQSISSVIKRVQSAGINVKVCIMLGLSNQTRKTLLSTLDFLTNLNVSIRPTIFSPYHLISETIEVDDIDECNRKTFYTQIEGVSYKDLLRLVINVMDYKKILGEDT